MAKKEVEFLDCETEFEWHPVHGDLNGLIEKILSIDLETESYTRLLRFPEGYEGKEVLIHPFWEEVYILEGYLIDVQKNRTFRKGYYACRPPSMVHGPYRSPEGCLTFEMRYFIHGMERVMSTLTFTLKRGKDRNPFEFKVRRMVNAGYVGRNQEEVRRHIEELGRKGIPGPSSTPTLYPIVPQALTQASRIEVFGDETSGEAEFVLLVENRDRIYAAAGSDHTDRRLEAFDITLSKQICPNVISKEVWLLDDLLTHWDNIWLRSWVTKNGKRSLYQEETLRSILSPQDLLTFVRSRVDRDLVHFIVFSGTIGLLGGEFVCGERFEVELYDPVQKDRLSISYEIAPLSYIKPL